MCPDPIALDFFKHQIAYQKTEAFNPLKGLPVLHVDVWQRGALTAFYVREKLNGFIPSVRMAYLFTQDGLNGGGTCPAEKHWKECVERFAGLEFANYSTQTCALTVEVQAMAAWAPSPDDPVKRRLAAEIRKEVESKWQGVQEIVIRDFNLKDPQLTIYLRMQDGDYIQGCDFHPGSEPHCVRWHSFGQTPTSSIQEWIFEKPYRLK